MTRESWLNQLTDKLRPAFIHAGFPLPDRINVSCGWPTRGALRKPGSKSRSVGQCFSAACSEDGTSELFISPAIASGPGVAAILVHELCHAALDCDGGHGPKFAKVARALGLTGPMTATVAAAPLEERINGILGQMAKYPHATLDKELLGAKKETCRQLKIVCPDCGYTARVTRKWIAVGLPTCPCGGEMEEPRPPRKLAKTRGGLKKKPRVK